MEFSQCFHPLFDVLGTNTQNTPPIDTHAPFIGDYTCAFTHESPYQMHAICGGSEDTPREYRTGCVAHEGRETTNRSPIGGKRQRKPDILFIEQIQNRVGMGLG
jgi:hypothetical protein